MNARDGALSDAASKIDPDKSDREPFYPLLGDETGNAAVANATSRRKSAPDLSFVCLECHAIGSTIDARHWTQLAGRWVHLRSTLTRKRTYGPLGDAEMRYTSKRRLCGAARQIGGGR